MLTEILNIHQL